MNTAEAKIRYQSGYFDYAEITYNEQGKWFLWMMPREETGRLVLLARARGGDAEYKTLDAAFNAAKEIGFETVKVFTEAYNVKTVTP